MNKENLTAFTKGCYNNLIDVQLVKFKGRKTVNHTITDTFNPDDYVILFKEGNHWYSIATVGDKQYKLIYDSSLTIQPVNNNFEGTDLNQNETFTVETFGTE